MIVSAKGHSLDDDWTYDKDAHWHKCSECDYVSDKDEHTFGDWSYTKKATYKEEGLKARTCTVCGYKETVKIPAIIEDSQTEDTTEDTTEETTDTTTEDTTEGTTTEGTTTEATTEVNTQVPQTGDEEDFSLYLILLGLSLSGVILIAGYRKHAEEER